MKFASRSFIIAGITAVLFTGCATNQRLLWDTVSAREDDSAGKAAVSGSSERYCATKSKVLDTVKVSKKPLSGQEWRASKDFTLNDLPPWALFVLFRVEGEHSDKLRFDLKLNKRFGDPYVFKNLKDGSAKMIYPPFTQATWFYFGGASDAKRDFKVQVIAIGGSVEECAKSGTR